MLNRGEGLEVGPGDIEGKEGTKAWELGAHCGEIIGGGDQKRADQDRLGGDSGALQA